MTNSEPSPAANAAPSNARGFSPALLDDDDIALGFECANPALQIERWMQDDAPAVRQYY